MEFSVQDQYICNIDTNKAFHLKRGPELSSVCWTLPPSPEVCLQNLQGSMELSLKTSGVDKPSEYLQPLRCLLIGPTLVLLWQDLQNMATQGSYYQNLISRVLSFHCIVADKDGSRDFPLMAKENGACHSLQLILLNWRLQVLRILYL